MAPLFLDDAIAAVAPPRRFWRGLSARLLVLTVAVILLAEVLIFVPSAASFRTQWLMERVEAAQIASLAVEASPNDMLPDGLMMELLENAEVEWVALRREGQRQLLLAGELPPSPPITVDLRNASLWDSLFETCMSFTAPNGRYLRVLAEPRFQGGEFIEVIVPERPLRRELFAYSRRIVLSSVFIALATGAVIYALLVFLFVRPMRRLGSSMVWFRDAPEDAERIIHPSGRKDEIGEAEAELAALQDEVRQALLQKERLAALGGAVAKINHDLRNILTTAQLVTDRLAASPDPKTRGQAERLVRAVDRGIRLAEEVLEYGKAEEKAPESRRVALRAALEDAFADASAVSERPTGLDMQVGDEVAVTADPEHVHRLFLNIMRNAVQAMAAHGERNTPGMLRLTALEDGDWIVVSVADDGPGVPESARGDLFTPFAGSTRRGGSGLGLSIARELAQAHGGDVTLAASGGEGAVFDVRLPAVQA